MLFIAILRLLLIFILKWIFIPKTKNFNTQLLSCNRCQDKVSMCEGIGIIGRYNMEDPVCGIPIQLPSNLRI